ncbi:MULTISPECIES: LysR family transcriptional regulator [Chromohalobacter]|uniref:LysR family transcriptional regulator n=2 Tax=Chromohalobacter TaxID=42054 RepID=UPI0005582F3A|nr:MULTISPECIES: LysR family transcriptional regulator [Chromohalobacter]MBZ5875938.1 LysR family transcriptional regulator [Chromohalobacter salexigens]MDF9435873.1 LysR family transcriptional regulator [Chromohalobacter israelensis]MDO0945979.1 LysR family transcriptional regulator [Chromohalobacter salexigens]NWO56303.1 LysR family transcriptional regulator [Chromohalobacter salexigens]
MMSLPPILWMQAFEAAARTLSFTQAGRELGVTQSAVSQRIRLLEDRLGQALFVRHPRSLSLTPAGQAWLPSIQEAFTRIAEGTAEVFGPHPDAPVTLRATPAVQAGWLATELTHFHRRHRDVTVRLVSAVWPGDFSAEGVDMEIRYGQGDWPDMEAVLLNEEVMLPVCAPGVARQLHKPEDLAGHTLLHAAGFALGWPSWLSLAGVEGLEARCASFICDTQVATLALAARGAGVALTHRRLFEGRDDLVAPFALSMPTDEAFWLVRPRARAPRPACDALWAWLRDVGELD